MAKIIAVEGPDRVGKATQTKMLNDYLVSCGKTVKTVEVPVHGIFSYPLIYLMLKTGLAKFFPNLFQFIQSLNKLTFQYFFLPLLKKKYDYVIFDRWSLSSLVYGESSGVNFNMNLSLFKKLEVPDLTVVINGPARNDEARDSYESDKSFQAVVRANYALWCEKNPKNLKTVNSLGTRDEVHKKIIKSLYEAFGSI